MGEDVITVTLTVVDREKLKKELTKLVRERYNCEAQVTVNLDPIHGRDRNTMESAMEYASKTAFTDEEIKYAIDAWVSAGMHRAEEGGSVPQQMAEKYEERIWQYLSRTYGPQRISEIRRLMDRVDVKNAKSTGDGA